MTAFAGESQARNKYTFYAKQAEDGGYRQISDIYKETAENERAHAEIWFRLLHGDGMPSVYDGLLDAAICTKNLPPTPKTRAISR